MRLLMSKAIPLNDGVFKFEHIQYRILGAGAFCRKVLIKNNNQCEVTQWEQSYKPSGSFIKKMIDITAMDYTDYNNILGA